MKQVEFSVKAMSIKLTSGEEIIGAVAVPSSKTFSINEKIAMGQHIASNVFFPAKVVQFIDPADNMQKVILTKWGSLGSTTHFSITNSTIVSMTPATQNGVEIYEKWMTSMYKTDPKILIREEVRNHFGVQEIGKKENDITNYNINVVFSSAIFAPFLPEDREAMYSTILHTFSPSAMH